VLTQKAGEDMYQFLLIAFCLLFAVPSFAQPRDWEPVEKILGRPGTVKGDMFKVVFPRTDLNVTIDGVPVDPRMGLTSWVAFRANRESMVTGDLVLRPGEVTTAIRNLQAEGLKITAVDSCLMHTSPQIMLVHFSGSGDTAGLANAIRKTLSETTTPLAAAPREPETVPEPEFAMIQSVLGPGRPDGSVLYYRFPRSEKITEARQEIPGFMGTSSSVQFQIIGEQAVSTGELALTAQEVTPVLQALGETNITVTALHNHLQDESPRLFFLHFRTVARPEIVAFGIKAALDRMNILRQTE
jgi:hypothetical protein